ARLGRDQPQATSDTVDVRIDGDRVAAERERQHDGRGLRTDAGERREVAPGLRVCHGSEPREVVGALALIHLPQDRLDAWGLRVRVRHRPGWYGARLTRTDRARRCGTASATARS